MNTKRIPRVGQRAEAISFYRGLDEVKTCVRGKIVEVSETSRGLWFTVASKRPMGQLTVRAANLRLL